MSSHSSSLSPGFTELPGCSPWSWSAHFESVPPLSLLPLSVLKCIWTHVWEFPVRELSPFVSQAQRCFPTAFSLTHSCVWPNSWEVAYPDLLNFNWDLIWEDKEGRSKYSRGDLTRAVLQGLGFVACSESPALSAPSHAKQRCAQMQKSIRASCELLPQKHSCLL